MKSSGQLFISLFAAGTIIAVACSNPSGPGKDGKGLCVTSCPKSCDKDSDCPNTGQLCCNFGTNFGKGCVAPQACPRFCTDDSKCRTDLGEACCAANPASTEKICVAATLCQKNCGSDNDCAGGATPKCCTNYAQPRCTSVAACPNACAQSTECNTASNQTCCTTIKATDKNKILSPNLTGVCQNQGASCPKACTQAGDCDTTRGELCCDGFCATSCQKTCLSSNECPTDKGQLCCLNSVIASPFYNFNVNPPPPPPPPPPMCPQVGQCTTTSQCTGGQVCCSTLVMPPPMDAGVDSGGLDAAIEGGLDAGDSGTIIDAGMDSGVMMPMCGMNCAYTCRIAATCTQMAGRVCN